MGDRKHVHIFVENGNVIVNPATVQVSQSRWESVVWHCHQGRAVIDFARKPRLSPFMDSQFHAPALGDVCSGPPIRGRVGQTYEYFVQVFMPNDKRTYIVDPEVEVIDGS